MVKRSYNWKGTLWIKGLQLFVNIVTSRVFLSFQTTLSSESPFMKVLDVWVIFPGQLKLPHLDIYRRIYGQNTKTTQSWKVVMLWRDITRTSRHTWMSRHRLPLSQLIPGVTSWHNVNSTSCCFSSSILHSNKSKVLLMPQLNLETCIKHKTKHKRHLEIKTSNHKQIKT